MAIKLPSNLHRNRYGSLYFRIAIPPDLRHYFNSNEIYRSLKTASVREATPAAQTLSIAFKRFFSEIRQQSMPDQNKAPKSALELFENLPDARQRLKAAGIQVALLEAEASRERAEDRHAESEEQRIKDKAQHERELSLLLRANSRTNKPQPIGGGGLLSSYVGSYIHNINANREEHDEINAQGIDDHKNSCKVLIEILGDKPLHELSIQDRNRYDDIIKRYPFNREKMKDTRGKALPEILGMSDYKTISLKTAKFHSSRANAFLNWVFRQEGQAVPFKLLEDVRVKKGKGVEKKRREFKTEELCRLFDIETFPRRGKYDKQSPYKFWIPLIGLHTGARLNEIAQLRLTDIVTIDRIPCFSITEEPDPEEEKALIEYLEKSVKTHAAKRTVPIHSRLIELGLLEYIESIKPHGHVMLFQDLAHAQIKYGALASKWFANHCDKIGLTDSALTFHSFRHGAIGHLRRKKVPKDLRMVVVGHSASEDTHDDYGDIHGDFTTTDKQSAIEMLDFSDALNFAELRSKAPTAIQLEQAVLRNKSTSQP